MNGQDPRVKLSLKEWQEILAWRGRDSRLVRAAMKWSLWKKNALNRLKYRFYRRRKNMPPQLQILFWLPGGLGDAACAKRLVSAYRFLLPDAQFDIYAPLPGVAQMLFGADQHTHILEDSKFSPLDYDLAVQACMAVKFLHADEARLEQLAPSFIPIWERALQAQESLGTLADDLFLTDGLLGRWLYARGGRRFDLLSYTGGAELPHDAQEKLSVSLEPLRRFGLQKGKYITFHDGTSLAQAVGASRPTRAWPAVRWCEFFRLFKKEFPDVRLVQLGGQNSPVYEEADVCLVNKTQVADLPALLCGARAHIDTESGLVHLAQFLDVRSVVIFGPSAPSFLGYAKNENLASGPCGGCMWTTADWMLNCPLGHTAAPCTECVTAADVLAALKRILQS